MLSVSLLFFLLRLVLVCCAAFSEQPTSSDYILCRPVKSLALMSTVFKGKFLDMKTACCFMLTIVGQETKLLHSQVKS